MMKKKKIIWALLALLFCMQAASALGAGVLTLPRSLTEIKDEAFYGDTSLVEVVLPEDIQRIGVRAFAQSSLTEIDLPPAVEFIGEGAFDGCEGILIYADEDSYAYTWAREAGMTVLPRPTADEYFKYKVISGEATITAYTGSDEDVIIPRLLYGYPVTKIGDGVFEDNINIASVVIPDSVTEIGASAFLHCENLLSIEIPDSVTAMGKYALAHCYKLQNVNVPAGMTAISDWTFASCKSLEAVEIPDSVKNIGLAAFQECEELTSVSFPSSLASVGAQAFYKCVKLRDAVLPDSVVSLGGYAFAACGALERANIPSGVTAIEMWTFAQCASLTEIEIPSGVTRIGKGAFQQCAGIEEVVIPDSVTAIEQQAFYQCTALKNASVPASVTEIGAYAFSSCHAQMIMFGARGSRAESFAATYKIPFAATGEAADSIFDYEIANGEVTITGYKRSDKAVFVPAEIDGYPVTRIGANAFEEDEDIVRVILPSGLIEIDKNAFKSCKEMTEIVIPDTVTIIGSRAFENCYALKEITIPSGVTKIDEWTFAMCKSLTSVEIPSGVVSIGLAAFQDCEKLEMVDIPDTVITVGKQAFNRCEALESIDIPASVTAIEAFAFQSCAKLKSISLHEGLKTIGTKAFNECGALTDIVLPDSVTSVGNQAFYKCASLESIRLSAGMKTISEWMLFSCTSLTDVEIPAGITTISASAFQACSALKYVDIPDSVTTIGKQAFYKCTALESIVIPSSVTALESYTFSTCTSLVSADIPASVATISSTAFKDCGDQLVIYGETGSAAETFAEANGIPFALRGYRDAIAGAVLTDGTAVYDADTPVRLYVGDEKAYTVQISVSEAWTGDQPAYYLYSDDPESVAVSQKNGTCTIQVKTDEGASLYVSAMEADSIKEIPSAYRHKICTVRTPVYRALLIGQTYAGNTHDIGELDICDDDRDGMQAMLETMQRTDYITTAKGELTRSQMLSAISSAFGDAEEGDVSLVYYSGHGVLSNVASTLGALVGYDFSLLTAVDLRNALDQIPGRKIVIMDSCHSGNFIGKDDQLGQEGSVSREELDTMMEQYNQSFIAAFAGASGAKSLAAENYYVVTAAHSSESSYTSSPYSVFTKPVIRGSGYGVTGGAMAADTSGDGMITLNECYRYAYDQALWADQHAQVYPENSDFVIWAK